MRTLTDELAQPELPLTAVNAAGEHLPLPMPLRSPTSAANSRRNGRSSRFVCGEPCPHGGEHASGRRVLHGRCNRPVLPDTGPCWQHRTTD